MIRRREDRLSNDEAGAAAAERARGDDGRRTEWGDYEPVRSDFDRDE